MTTNLPFQGCLRELWEGDDRVSVAIGDVIKWSRGDRLATPEPKMGMKADVILLHEVSGSHGIKVATWEGKGITDTWLSLLGCARRSLSCSCSVGIAVAKQA